MSAARRLLRPGLAAAPVLVALLGLGAWQLQRLQWKQGVLAAIAAAEAGPPVPLADPPQPFARVLAAGRFLHEREALLGLEVRGAVLGARLLVPLERDGAVPVLVDRGWVPMERAAPLARPEGEVRVVGYVKPAERAGMFSARDDTAGRRFYSFNPVAIGSALGLGAVAPYGLVALAAPGAPPMLPDPARSLPRPANNHLGYVITWWGLAVALVGVFAVWARRRLEDSAE